LARVVRRDADTDAIRTTDGDDTRGYCLAAKVASAAGTARLDPL
jgi:hypothetical protein